MQLTNPKPHTPNPTPRAPRLRYVPLQSCDPCEFPGADDENFQPVRKPGRFECKCGKSYAGGSVMDDRAVIDEVTGEASIVRRVFCDHCCYVIVWCELAARDDKKWVPTGRVISGPGVYRSKTAVERFLKAHPEAAGMLQEIGA